MHERITTFIRRYINEVYDWLMLKYPWDDSIVCFSWIVSRWRCMHAEGRGRKGGGETCGTSGTSRDSCWSLSCTIPSRSRRELCLAKKALHAPVVRVSFMCLLISLKFLNKAKTFSTVLRLHTNVKSGSPGRNRRCIIGAYPLFKGGELRFSKAIVGFSSYATL